jgi:CRISPR-associated endonuclease Cas2
MVVIAYDIKDEKRLRRVAKYLEEHGIRAQRSVFEVDMSVKKAKEIFGGLKEFLADGDKCFLFKVEDKKDIKAKTDIERIL